MEIMILISCVLGFLLGSSTVFLASKKFLVYKQKVEMDIPIEIPKNKTKPDPQSEKLLDSIESLLGYDGKDTK